MCGAYCTLLCASMSHVFVFAASMLHCYACVRVSCALRICSFERDAILSHMGGLLICCMKRAQRRVHMLERVEPTHPLAVTRCSTR